ncbi:class I SAM-dependent methyltransferase [Kribbella antibiotica]|uniref:Class I SAM-dependent methyltransferase n=1 Tax=Kribbella antibiotica TaxID=190195 RepID=A0A4R4Z172_9ACTN|nr:class I SAM-dependent methyltransferase [Kribbella antibiotica]TDD50694.1 class I SAM-dependent methyltransferase [Kribbella antibiotica]
MDWAKNFYSETGRWWAKAEARIGDRDHHRVAQLHEYAGKQPHRVLELGPGYGTTAAVTANAGHTVTAVELSDRATVASAFAAEVTGGTMTVINDDFYAVQLEGPFDVVSYWNGFGIGSDADQRRLLTRIAAEWLRPGGVALIDVSNPFVWASWHGDEEHLMPNPEQGYEHELYETTTFDPITSTATDTWWRADLPEEKHSQHLRCYTPADLALLVAGTGLTLTTVVGDPAGLLKDQHEYLAVLHHEV